MDVDVDGETEWEAGSNTAHSSSYSGGDNGASDSGVCGVQDPTAADTASNIEGIARDPHESAEQVKSVFNVAPDANGELHGRVVGVIRRNWRQYAGSLDLSGGEKTGLTAALVGAEEMAVDADGVGGKLTSATVQFVPVNKRIPRVLITTRRLEELSNSRLLVSIDHWPADSLYPQGHYVRVLGAAGDKGVETQVLLHEFDVPHEAFTPEVMACLPSHGEQST